MADCYGKEYIDAHALFGPIKPEHHRVIPQSGVKQYVFPDTDRHNAIWDYYVTSEGRHYFSNCAEGDFSECFSLCEYFPHTNTVKKLFDFQDTVLNYPRTIRASKVHTSMTEMEDGKIIMLTHTTAAAPGHPVWMPRQYYNHMWEGFPGSNLIIFDPKTGKVEDLGIPVRRESLYGGIYSPKAKAFFASSLMRGHVFRIDLANRHVTDYGNLTEGACCCVRIGSDENVYLGTACGELIRINTETLKYEDIGIRLQVDWRQDVFQGMMYGVNGPDGRLYFDPVWTENLHAYDPKTNKLEIVGSVLPEELAVYPWKGMIYGFDFDADGVLWYGLMLHPKQEGVKNRVKKVEVAFYLCSWNFLQGGKPVCYGLMGTEKRRVLVFSEAHVTGNLFIGADTNHWWDPVSMFQVDLDKVKTDHAAGIAGPFTRDTGHYTYFQKGYEVYPGDLCKDSAPLYAKMEKERVRTEKYQQMAAEFGVQGAKEIYVTKFWREIGHENANIVSVRFESNGILTAVCGRTEFHEFTVKRGEILSRLKLDPKVVDAGRSVLKEKYGGVRFPANAGRRWLAVPTAEAFWHDGSTIVGTKDGLLAIVKDGKVYALGGVGACGPVRDLCVNAMGTKLWGVAGDAEDLGMLFTYDDTDGLVQIGPVEGRDIRPQTGERCLLNVPSAVAVYGDGNALAVGSEDFKAALIEYYF